MAAATENAPIAGPTEPVITAAPTDLSAKARGSSRIELSWNDNSPDEEGFRIERSTDKITYAEIARVGADVTSYSDSAVEPGTFYAYRLSAYGKAGDSPSVEEFAIAGALKWNSMPSFPTTVYRPAVAYDIHNTRMIAFGGHDANYVFSNAVQVLSLSGAIPSWTNLQPGGTPPQARAHHTAIYDSMNRRLIVFGGWVNGVGASNDAWELSLSDSPTWTQLIPGGSAPSARYYHTAVYDAAHQRMVVFGGVEGSGPSASSKNDVWALSLSDSPMWSQLTPGGAAPSVRYGHSAVYHAAGQRMIVFGGRLANGLCDDRVWILTLGQAPGWEESAISGPPARVVHTAILDSANERMIIFGGRGNDERNDVWALSLSNELRWQELIPTAGSPIPPSRNGHAAVYDSVNQRLIILGGFDFPNFYADVWGLDI